MVLALPLLLSLLGCINSSAWPHYNGQGGADTGGGTTYFPPTTPTLPCNRADEGTTARLQVNNPNPVPYQLSQMDITCNEQMVAIVAPNDAYITDVGNHIFWIVREENGDYVRFFGLPSGSSVSWVETLP